LSNNIVSFAELNLSKNENTGAYDDSFKQMVVKPNKIFG
jgi:hypothetical protein